jgi:hypothetical protein
MRSTSTPWLYFVLASVHLLLPATLTVVVFVLSRRRRSSGLWWIAMGAGVWPCIAAIATWIYQYVLAWLGTLGRSLHWTLVGYYGLAALLALIGFLFLLRGAVQIARELGQVPTAQPNCPRCGYNLTGLTENRCPECGVTFECQTRYLVRAL